VRDECQATRLLPIDECVGHRGLTDPRLPGDENDLPFALARHPFETLVKLGERVITSDQDLRGTRRRRATCRRASVTGAMNRYPRRDIVSMNMGFLASSPSTARMAAMWLFKTSG